MTAEAIEPPRQTANTIPNQRPTLEVVQQSMGVVATNPEVALTNDVDEILTELTTKSRLKAHGAKTSVSSTEPGVKYANAYVYALLDVNEVVKILMSHSQSTDTESLFKLAIKIRDSSEINKPEHYKHLDIIEETVGFLRRLLAAN